MAPFFTSCPYCGATTLPQLTLVGNVLGVSCGNCHAHLKYKNHARAYLSLYFPKREDINTSIWILCGWDSARIQHAAGLIGFKQTETYAYSVLMYYRLYKYLYERKADVKGG